jgi:hypothetical protein
VGIYNDNAFLRKYDSSGNVQWTSQLDLAHSTGVNVTADSLGNVYVAGEISHSTVFVAKYDASGNSLWTRQLGDSTTWCGGVAADGQGNVYVSGSGGYISSGCYDAFLTKYDANGNQLWNHLIDCGGDDRSYGLAADPTGGVYLSDEVEGDVFVLKYDAAGNQMWSQCLGTSAYEMSYSCAASNLGSVFVTGYTEGDFGAQNAGVTDLFVAEISSVPEPSTLVLLGIGAIGFLGWAWRRRKHA